MGEIVYPITLGYRKHWGEWEAIRELVQNALDSSEDFEIKRDGCNTIIRDYGDGIAIRHLLFGVSEKKEGARGQFGEGLKIALIVLKRLGYHVTIRSNGLLIETSEAILEGERCLKLVYRHINPPVKGTEITIHGYQGPTFEDRFVNSRKNIIWSGNTVFGDKGEIIEEANTALYVKDIFVQELPNARFSYNLSNVKLEESRGIADPFSLSLELGYLWRNVGIINLIVEFFRAVKEKRWEAKNVYISSPPRYPAKWRAAFHEVYGKNAVVKTSDSWEREAEWEGAEVVELPTDLSGLVRVLPTDVSFTLERRSSEIVEVPDSQLSSLQLENLQVARNIVSYMTGHYEAFKNVSAIKAYLPKDNQDLGCWQPASKTIYLSKRVLETRFTTLDSLVHELGHALYGAADATIAMIRAVSNVAALILTAYRVGER